MKRAVGAEESASWFQAEDGEKTRISRIGTNSSRHGRERLRRALAEFLDRGCIRGGLAAVHGVRSAGFSPLQCPVVERA